MLAHKNAKTASSFDDAFKRLDNNDRKTVLNYIDFLLSQPKYSKKSGADAG